MAVRWNALPVATGTLAGLVSVGLVFGFGADPSAPPPPVAANAPTVSHVLPLQADVRTAELRQPATTGAAPSRAPSPAALPDPEVAAAASHRHVSWTRKVWTVGGQAQIDQCRGLVRVAFGNGTSVIAEHNVCGGAWILKIKRGQLIRLTGKVKGVYKATAFKAVPVGSSINVLRGMSNVGIVLQTCYFNSNKMRLVGLERVGR